MNMVSVRNNVISIAGFILCLYADSVTSDPMCVGCVIDNGFGYNPYAGDCTKYIQCYPNGVDAYGKTTFRSAVKQCGWGTYWSQDKLTCIRYDHTSSCLDTFCEGQPNRKSLPYLGCGSFLACVGGKAIPMCCLSGQIYDAPNENCVDDVDNACPDSCSSGPKNATVCNRSLNAEDNTTYFETIYFGFTSILRSCAPGTLYNPDTCLCSLVDNNPVPTTPHACTPLIKQGQNQAVGTEADSSEEFIGRQSNNLAYGNLNVLFPAIQDYAVFGGNGELNMWSLAHYDFKSEFAVTFSILPVQFTGEGGSLTEQILINCYHTYSTTPDGIASISIKIEKHPGNMYSFTACLVTESGQQSLTTPKILSTGYIDITLAYDGTNMVFRADGQEVFTPLTGNIIMKQTGLVFGKPLIKHGAIQFLQGQVKHVASPLNAIRDDMSFHHSISLVLPIYVELIHDKCSIH